MQMGIQMSMQGGRISAHHRRVVSHTEAVAHRALQKSYFQAFE